MRSLAQNAMGPSEIYKETLESVGPSIALQKLLNFAAGFEGWVTRAPDQAQDPDTE